MNGIARLATLAVVSAPLVGCVWDDDHQPRGQRYDDPAPQPAPAPTGSTGQPAPPPSTSQAPMLVVVDTDQTMTADPGQGVGVFIEYASGGKWLIWWTCDTAKTGQDCDFSVSATAASGTLSNIDATYLAGGYLTTPTPSRVDAKIKTSSETHGISFQSEPGGVITVEASVGAVKDGSFLFFVQDGKVNGGYAGALTNPLQLQGKTP